VDEVKLAFMDHVKIKMAGRRDLRDKGTTKTWCRGRSQRPYFDIKKGKAHGEIHTGSGSFPNRDLHGRQVLITDSKDIYF
jgi:hypothetical protein